MDNAGSRVVVADMIRGLFKTVRVVLAREGEALGALAEELRGDLNRTIERLDRVVDGKEEEAEEKGLLTLMFRVMAPLPFVTQVVGHTLADCVEWAKYQRKLYSLCMQCTGRPKTRGWAIHSTGDLHPEYLELQVVECLERNLSLMEKREIQELWLQSRAGSIPTKSVLVGTR